MFPKLRIQAWKSNNELTYYFKLFGFHDRLLAIVPGDGGWHVWLDLTVEGYVIPDRVGDDFGCDLRLHGDWKQGKTEIESAKKRNKKQRKKILADVDDCEDSVQGFALASLPFEDAGERHFLILICFIEIQYFYVFHNM